MASGPGNGGAESPHIVGDKLAKDAPAANLAKVAEQAEASKLADQAAAFAGIKAEAVTITDKTLPVVINALTEGNPPQPSGDKMVVSGSSGMPGVLHEAQFGSTPLPNQVPGSPQPGGAGGSTQEPHPGSEASHFPSDSSLSPFGEADGTSGGPPKGAALGGGDSGGPVEGLTPPQVPDALVDASQSEQQKVLDAATKTIAAIEQKHSGKTWDGTDLDKMKTDFGTDYSALRDAEVDADLAQKEMDWDKQANNNKDSDDELKKIETQRMDARAKASLDKNDEYRALNRELEAYKDFALLTDEQVGKLKGKKLKAFQEYCDKRIGVGQQEISAKYDALRQRAQDGYDDKGNQTLTSPESIHKEVAKIEVQRRQDAEKLRLDNNPEYIKHRPNLDRVKERIKKSYFSNATGDKAEIEEKVNRQLEELLKHDWKDLREQNLFGEEKDRKKNFDDAKYAKEIEAGVKRKVQGDRVLEGYDDQGNDLRHKADGSPRDPKEVIDLQARAMTKALTDSEAGPTKFREKVKAVNEFIENWFGKRTAEEKAKESSNLLKGLMGDYGIFKGLMPWFIRNEVKRKDAMNRWKQAMKARGKWLQIHAFRFPFRMFLILSLLGLAFPPVIGKGLEITKPFGGNG